MQDESEEGSLPPLAGMTELSAAEDSNIELPAVNPPKTKTPVQVNQQNNFYQTIPSNAWDRLSADQVVALSKDILHHMDAQDERNYNFAIERVKQSDARGKLNAIIGAVVALAGFLVTAYLATHNHEFVALTISLPLATIIAMVVGNQFIS